MDTPTRNIPDLSGNIYKAIGEQIASRATALQINNAKLILNLGAKPDPTDELLQEVFPQATIINATERTEPIPESSNIVYQEQRLDQLQAQDNSVDLITVGIAHAQYNLTEVLKEFKRVLRPEAIALVAAVSTDTSMIAELGSQVVGTYVPTSIGERCQKVGFEHALTDIRRMPYSTENALEVYEQLEKYGSLQLVDSSKDDASSLIEQLRRIVPPTSKTLTVDTFFCCAWNDDEVNTVAKLLYH